MYIVEYFFPVLLFISFAISFLIGKKNIWIAYALLSVGQVLILAFRPEDYNSDTFNYSKYLTYISDADGVNIFTASKFEPIHLGIALISNDFRIWLILEALLCSIFLIGILRRLQTPESVAVILGSAVPLFSSSMRFSVGLLAIAYAMLIIPRMRGRAILISAIGLMTHISLAAFGIIQRGKFWQFLILMLILLIYVGSDASFVDRAGGGEDSSAGGSGLRAFATLLIFLIYSYCRFANYKIRSFFNDILIALILLFSTNFIYPVFNRFIVLFLITKAIQFDSFGYEFSKKKRLFSGVMAVVLYLLLVIPHLVSMDNKLMAGDW